MTTEEKMKLIAENQQKVYDTGYNKGKAAGIDAIETEIDNIITIQDSLITHILFSIDGVTYTATKGMTWAEWCDSEYNVNMEGNPVYEIDADGWFCHLSGDWVDLNGVGQYGVDTIVPGATYTIGNA